MRRLVGTKSGKVISPKTSTWSDVFKTKDPTAFLRVLNVCSVSAGQLVAFSDLFGDGSLHDGIPCTDAFVLVLVKS